MIETDADRLAFLSILGQTVTVNGNPISAIFDAEYISPLNVASTNPVLTCRSIDVASVVRGNASVVGAVNYTVRGIEPDGTGITLLILERA